MINCGLKKKFNIFLVLILLLGIKSSFASETFNNNLLKTELHKSSIGGIKIDLYTGKPYSDAVSVNKKSANEYVILLPETSNSLTAKPNLSHVSDVVKSVDVKSQSYQNNIKGYTKIIVHSYQPIEISTHVQAVSPNNIKITENEYKELLSQASKKPAVVKANASNNTKMAKKAIAVDKKQTAKALPAKVKSQVQVQKPSKTIISAEPIKNKAKSITLKSAKSVDKIVVKKNSLTKQNSKIQKPVVQKPVVIAPQVTKVETAKTEPNSVVVPKKIQPASTNQIAQVPSNIKPENISQNPASNLLSIALIKAKILKLVQLAKNNVYYAIGIVIAAFFVLLMIAKRMSSGIKRSQVNFASNLQDKPTTPINYQDKISDDMTWKEKFKACSDNEQNVSDSDLKDDIDLKNTTIFEQQSMDGFIPSSDELDELFNPENIAKNNVNEVVPDETAEPEQVLEDEYQQIANNLDEFYTEEDVLGSDISVDDIFDDDEIFIQPVLSQNETQDETVFESAVDEQTSLEDISDVDDEIVDEVLENNLVKSEFVIDEATALYLVDYENNSALVGRINDNFFVLKQFDEKINAPLKARLNEQNLNSVSYMTKVGGFRGVVEVTPDNMNLLIEL